MVYVCRIAAKPVGRISRTAILLRRRRLDSTDRLLELVEPPVDRCTFALLPHDLPLVFDDRTCVVNELAVQDLTVVGVEERGRPKQLSHGHRLDRCVLFVVVKLWKPMKITKASKTAKPVPTTPKMPAAQRR
jgi:hypothetical protein